MTGTSRAGLLIAAALVLWSTGPRSAQESRAEAAALDDLSPLSYAQSPAVLSPNETGAVQIVLEVLGDLSAVSFRRNVPTAPGGFITERWNRATTRAVDGRLVSVFDQSYDGEILGDLVVYPHGHDRPQVPLGRLEVPGSEPMTLWLRIAPSDLPEAPVRVAGDGAQYSSHVVNLVAPGFLDARISGGVETFDFQGAAQAFYTAFADVYHTLAFIPSQSPLGAGEGLHLTVINDISGIGQATVDNTAAFGSSMLRSVQVYPAGFAGTQQAILHQLGHQWGDETQLAAMAGATAAGADPARHTPLVDGGPTLLGAVLSPTRLVEERAGAWQIVRADPPIGYHPLQRYRMGLLDVGVVPEVRVFMDQGQFDGEDLAAPAVGTTVTDEWSEVDINDLLATLGARQGPVFDEWRQAFVVVSDALLSQREMDYYNFYARRAGADEGTRSVEGFGSFFEATGGLMSLRTDIDPADRAANPELDPDGEATDVPFGTRDWRGIVLDDPLPSLIASGTTLTVTGSVDPEILSESYQFLILRLTRNGAPAAEPITVLTTISGGRFSLPLGFTDAAPGGYVLDLFVYDDPSGSALPAGALTPLFVD